MTFDLYLKNHLELVSSSSSLAELVDRLGKELLQSVLNGGKVLVAGNGGSAADSQHFAAELMVKYKKERIPYPAIALTTDSSVLTAHSNDFDYSTIFERQIEALGRSGDVLIAISTSGNSENILNAVDSALSKGMDVILLTGKDGGKLAKIVPDSIIVPSKVTSHIQEIHICILHYFCELFE